MFECPSGSWCPLGSSQPRPCGLLSICPAGSKINREFVGIAIALVVDILILLTFLYIRGSSLFPHESHQKRASFVTKKKGDTARVLPEQNGVMRAFKNSMSGSSLCIHLKFQNLGLNLPNGKRILCDVTGEIEPGRFTAIMGPSGSGKTTFLNVLLGKTERTKGELFINEVQADLSKFKNLIGFVPQDDIMLEELTVAENLRHACRIRAPANWTDKDCNDYIQELMISLNLLHVQDSVIGDEVQRGISGGQRKRVNIGLELAGLPIAIFLDEPTSGLDSTAALNIAFVLKDLAQLGLTTVAVIHQPRTEIFNELDEIILMVPGGKIAYLGPRIHIVEYFETLGFDFDPLINPADVLMDIVSSQVAGRVSYSGDDLAAEWEHYKRTGCSLLQSFARKIDTKILIDNDCQGISDNENQEIDYSYYKNAASPVNILKTKKPRDSVSFTATRTSILVPIPNLRTTLARTMSVKVPKTESVQRASAEELISVCERRGASFFTQFKCCFNRSFLQQYRKITGLVWETAVATLCGLLIGLNMRRSKGEFYRGILIEPASLLSAAPLETFIPQVGLILAMGVVIASGPAGTNVFGNELPNFYRESSSGNNKAAYYLAKTISSIPRLALSALHMASIWHTLATPGTSIGVIYGILSLQFFGMYGISSIISFLIRREYQAVIATLVGFVPASFSGNSPNLADLINEGFGFALDWSYTRWANEAFYSSETSFFLNIYKVHEVSIPIVGYTLDRIPWDFMMMLLIGIILRLLAFFALIAINRSKQR